MICGTFVLDKVPAANADGVVNGFRTNIPPPTSVTKTQNADGTWKVTATWPPCPTGTASSHDPGNADAG